MTTSTFPTPEQLSRAVYELLLYLHNASSRPSEIALETIKTMTNNIMISFEKRIERVDEKVDTMSYEREWSMLTWSLLSMLTRLSLITPQDSELHNIQLKVNSILVMLVNKSRPSSPPMGMQENQFEWAAFWPVYSQTLNALHELYSQIEKPSRSLELQLASFTRRELPLFIERFRKLCLQHRNAVMTNLRMAQVKRMSRMCELDPNALQMASAYYTHVTYTLGVVAARLQGFRWESLQTKYPFNPVDPVWPLLEQVVQTMEQLVSDCMLATKPSTSAILVTNNLFPFDCGCLIPDLYFKNFDVQIVSEDTAAVIQNEMISIREGNQVASVVGQFSSAALLAMKPTTGVKRNNATANAEGGNTAHKKSDVNSRESVCISPTWSDPHSCWQATYPHLLCTTRQKDTVLLDNRSGQMGKRPLFYFYIRGTMFSPMGGLTSVRTLSLPFTIATRRNQDCQVQRMMSSYTATCFWLYGLHNLDGLLLTWCDSGIPWSRFVDLYRSYFMVNAEVNRSLSDHDFHLMEDKLTCEDCRDHRKVSDGERLVTFKNVLCPHLRYDTDNHQMRFSIWRGLLEVLQIYQDGRTNVKRLWNDHVIMGFSDVDFIDTLLLPRTSVMCLRLSHVTGGSICISMRPGNGDVVHLEPIDLKRLQAKSISDYMADIAESSRIEYVLTGNLEMVRVSELIKKYANSSDANKPRLVTSNITHGGSTDKMMKTRFTSLRIAVVTCCPQQETTPEDLMSPTVTSNGFTGAVMNPPSLCTPTGGPTFEAQLEALMKTHGKSATDVMQILNYSEPLLNQFMDSYILPTTDYGQWPETSCSVTNSTSFV